ncbi:MAG: response regulator transcription factor [Bacillota bacterium]
MSLAQRIKQLLTNNETQIDTLLYKERKTFFDTPQIKTYYDLLKTYTPKTKEAILTYLWLAMLSGDNRMLYMKGNSFDPSDLPLTSQAFYYNLRALSTVFSDDIDRVSHAKKALELLKDDRSFYKANAYLTYAQILAGTKKLRQAAEIFSKAFTLFIDNSLLFPATVSITNALLNYFRIGEFDTVIKTVRQTRIITSSFEQENTTYVDIILLPLGMTYLELGNLDLAKSNLLKAKRIINDAKLIHMHGYIEIYLLKLYHATNDTANFNHLLNETKTTFKTMHYPMMQVIIYYGKLLNNTLSKEDIITIETTYLEGSVTHPVIIEILLALLKDNQLSAMSIDQLIPPIDAMRYAGDRVALMQALCYIADYYTKETKTKEATLILEEIIALYHTYSIKGPLLLHTYSFIPTLKKMDKSIQVKKPKTILTEKEKEILTLIETGHSNQSIAETLYITVGTVKWHINHILSKLYAQNRHDAVKKAKKDNII